MTKKFPGLKDKRGPSQNIRILFKTAIGSLSSGMDAFRSLNLFSKPCICGIEKLIKKRNTQFNTPCAPSDRWHHPPPPIRPMIRLTHRKLYRGFIM